MRMRSQFHPLPITLLLVSLLTVFLPSPAVMQERGSGIVNIKLQDGKQVRLYDKSYAIVIGVSDYVAGWSNLPGVKKDMEAVVRALELHGFQVTVVMNPSSVQLDKSYRAFIDEYGAGVENRLLLYFAGHGHTEKQSYGSDMGYIVPADAPRPDRDPAGFRSKAMDMQQMEVYARRIQSKHALFLFDSCFSGSIFALSRAVPEIISYKSARPVRQFVTSGSADELVSDESVFRRQFVEAIEGEADGNRDGYVTGTELGEFLQERVVNYTRNAQHPQYGKIRDSNLDKGDFVFALPNAERSIPTITGGTVKVPGSVTRARSGIELVYVPPGEFMMGSESDKGNEKPVHRVTFREGFWMGKYEVTQTQWQAVMGDNPSHFKGCDNCPVEQMLWDEVQEFLQKLNTAKDGFIYRLPSEAEWEYAARGGTTTEFAFGDSLSSAQANFDGNYPYGGAAKGVYLERTAPVGSYRPNRFGLYDMHGNVSEWVQDLYHYDYDGAPTDGSAWLSGGVSNAYVMRGGTWYSKAKTLRSAGRDVRVPPNRPGLRGFRLVAVAR